MELFYRKLGKGKPLIILHGLFGSSDNWFSVARELSSTFAVYLVDQRNHGNSPHNPVHNFEAMRDDLYDFFGLHHIQKAILLGHSMGGKTAMFFALKYPQFVEKLIVVDISPLGYNNSGHLKEVETHKTLLHILLSFDLDTIKIRSDADNFLGKKISSPAIRQFLLKNLKRSPDGKFSWAINLDSLAHNIDKIYDGIDAVKDKDTLEKIAFPILFIKGEYSPYIQKNDIEAIRQFFPHANIVTIPGAGHWVHAEQPALLLKTIRDFIGDEKNQHQKTEL